MTVNNTINPNVTINIPSPYVEMYYMIRPMTKDEAHDFIESCRQKIYEGDDQEFVSVLDTVQIASDLGLLKKGMAYSFMPDLADKGWMFSGNSQYFADHCLLYKAAENDNGEILYGIMFPYYNVYC